MKQFDGMMKYYEVYSMGAWEPRDVAMLQIAEQLTRIADYLDEIAKIQKHNTAKYMDDMR